MTTKQLGIMGLIGAPFLCVGVYVESNYAPLGNSWWTGVWGILYCTGWMASLEVLRRFNLTGIDRFGKNIVRVVLGTLLVANTSNVWQFVAPTYKPVLFQVLDIVGWPLSNILMLGVGAAVVRAKRLTGWYRWVPLAVGAWLPFTMAVSRTPFVLHLSNVYSAIAWTMLAVVALRQTDRHKDAFIADVNRLSIESNQPVVL